MRIVLRCDVLNIMLIEVQLIGIAQEYCKLLIIQPLWLHLSCRQCCNRHIDLAAQLTFIAFKQYKVVKRFDNLIIAAQRADIIDAVVHNLQTRLVLRLTEHTVFKGVLQVIHAVILNLQMAIIHDRSLDLNNVCRILEIDRTQNASQAALNGIVAAEFTEKTELHRRYFEYGAEIFRAIFDKAAADTGKGRDSIHRRPVGLCILELGHFASRFIRSRRPAGTNLFFLLGRDRLAFQQPILLLTLCLFFLQPRLALPFGFRRLLVFKILLKLHTALFPLLASQFPESQLVFLTEHTVKGQFFVLAIFFCVQHLVIFCAGKPPYITKMTQDVQHIDIVWLCIQPHQQTDCQNAED